MSSLYILDINPLLDVGLVKIFSCLLVALLSYWQCPLIYRNFIFLWGPICQFLILEYKLLVFYSGNLPLCPCAQGSSPLSFLLVLEYLVLCGCPWSIWTWATDFFELILYPASLLKMFFNCRSSLVEFLGPHMDNISSAANSQIVIIWLLPF